MFTEVRRGAVLAAAAAVMAGLAATAGVGLASASPAHDGGCWCIQTERPATTTTTAAMTPMVEGPTSDGEVDGNGVRIHQWPELNAPVLGLAYDGQHVAVLSWGSAWDEILWRGQEGWISARYVFSDGGY